MELASNLNCRRCAPVFVVGSARSGTTLLYDTLLSAGGFAIYLGESNIFNLLAPRFGDLRVRKNREKMLNVWLGSRLFRVSGLERWKIEERVHDCQNAGDFLRVVMDELARAAECLALGGKCPGRNPPPAADQRNHSRSSDYSRHSRRQRRKSLSRKSVISARFRGKIARPPKVPRFTGNGLFRKAGRLARCSGRTIRKFGSKSWFVILAPYLGG